MKIIVAAVVICLLGTSVLAETMVEGSKPPLIQQGTVEVSTLGSYLGTNMLGLGAGVFKAADDWIGTLGLSIGYFLHPLVELEGSFGYMRMWDADYSQTVFTGIGKFVFNYVTPETTTVPYFFGGAGLIYMGVGSDWVNDAESDTLITFGGGVKVPLVLVRQSAVRIEYSYIKNPDEEDPVHNVSIGFSVFF